MERSYGFFEEDELGKLADVVLWKRLWGYIRPDLARVLAAIACSLAVIGTTLTLPYLVRLAIDSYITAGGLALEQRLSGLARLSAVFSILLAGGFAAAFLQVTILEKAGQAIMHRLRQDIFSRLLAQEMAFFNATPAGKLVTRLTNDVQNMHEMFTSVIVTLFNDFLQMTAILLILYALDVRLALVMTALAPVTGLVTWLFSGKARDAFRAIRTRLAAINAFLQETLGGVHLLQVFGRVEDTENDFRRRSREFREAAMRQVVLFGFYLPLIEMIGAIAIVLIVWHGGARVLSGGMSLGALAAFIFYMRLFFKPVKELSQKYSIVQSALASAERIFELIDRRPALPSGGARRPHRLRGHLEFSGVRFSYTGGKPALDGVSFTIAEQERIAFVGATGSGKTTVINLLERLYEPDSGDIRLDGHPIADYDTGWLRSHIGLVMQDVYLVSGTIRENICFSAGGEADQRRLERVLRDSRLDRVVAALPRGLDTVVGEGGFELSTGQKQLLALARVLMRDPGLLILDEATASIDSVTEAMIGEAVRTAMAGRTCIIIAHRLSTIRHCGRILVFDKGKVVEQGTPERLIAAGGHFARLLREQAID